MGEIKMKFLNLHDTHIKGKNSIYRKGDYQQDCMLKLKETIALSIEHKCKYIIHSGDLYDSPIVAYSLIDEVTDMIESAGIPWYIIAGNHDEIGQNWENSERSSLAHFIRRSKIIYKMDEIKDDNVFIKGYDYHYDINDSIRNGMLNHAPDDRFTIAIPHAFITEKPFLPMVDHVEAKDIQTNYDLILCSHFHSVFDFEVNSTRYVNNGAWGRLSIHEAKHIPKVSIIDTDTREVKVIDLKSAKPGKEVFDLTRKNDKVEFGKNIDDFIEDIGNFKTQGMDLFDVLKIVAKKQEAPKVVLDCINKRVGELENKGA
ncbi:MAG TPA: hypothetical protein ENI76_07945 [Ignavibacteria bacterium]|nr:hypothetical protein [Ignavibacteria bacterium]